MIRIKHVIFLSRSHLAHNVLEILISSVNKRVSLTCYTDLAALMEAKIAHPIALIIVDHNVFLSAGSEHQIAQDLSRRFFKSARKILLYGRDARFDEGCFRDVGFAHFFRKPFLPEEFVGVVRGCLRG